MRARLSPPGCDEDLRKEEVLAQPEAEEMHEAEVPTHLAAAEMQKEDVPMELAAGEMRKEEVPRLPPRPRGPLPQLEAWRRADLRVFRAAHDGCSSFTPWLGGPAFKEAATDGAGTAPRLTASVLASHGEDRGQSGGHLAFSVR